jgi:glutamate 5-kinase
MRSKLDAVRLVTQAGGSVVITSGLKAEPLTRILAGERLGTLFLAKGPTQGARKRWIGLTARPRGHYIVDPGARRALEAGAGSLLPIGIVEVVGDFDKGDVVGIRDVHGEEFARGLTNFATSEARRIQGLRTEQARQTLGASFYTEVVHRDNLVLIL